MYFLHVFSTCIFYIHIYIYIHIITYVYTHIFLYSTIRFHQTGRAEKWTIKVKYAIFLCTAPFSSRVFRVFQLPRTCSHQQEQVDPSIGFRWFQGTFEGPQWCGKSYGFQCGRNMKKPCFRFPMLGFEGETSINPYNPWENQVFSSFWFWFSGKPLRSKDDMTGGWSPWAPMQKLKGFRRTRHDHQQVLLLPLPSGND